MSRFKLPRPWGQQDKQGWGGALSSLRSALDAERQHAQQAARWVEGLPARVRRSPLADPDPGPPPQMPDMQAVMAEARQKALKVGAVTAGVATWKEAYDLYIDYQQGEPVTPGKVWRATKRVGQRGMAASRATSRRHITIVSLDTAARVLAWQSARRASRSAAWKAVYVVSKNLAGRVGTVMMAAEVFQAMRLDLLRYREGKLEERNFYRNCVLTGVAVAAPMAGASLGPVGGTVGLAMAVGAGMMRK